MSTARPNKPVKVPAKTIVSNVRRRSRSEGTMFHMSLVSYPHCIIGNVVNLLSGGRETDLRRAVNTERNMAMLEYIREVSVVSNEGKLSFYSKSAKLDPNISKAKALAQEPVVCFDYRDGSMEPVGTLVALLLEYFHGTQVRGMTRKHPMDTGTWEVRSSRLNLDKQVKGLDGLKLEVDTQQPTLAEVKAMLESVLTREAVSVVFGAESINYVTDGSSVSIRYIPE